MHGKDCEETSRLQSRYALDDLGWRHGRIIVPSISKVENRFFGKDQFAALQALRRKCAFSVTKPRVTNYERKRRASNDSRFGLFVGRLLVGRGWMGRWRV